METISLAAQKREKLGKGGSRALRRQGQIPAVLYGLGRETLTLSLSDSAITHAIGAARHSVIALDLQDGVTENVIVKQVQRHPVKHNILHLDLLVVDLDQDVDLPVTIELVGEPAGVAEGGMLDHQLREVSVRGRPDRIPDSIEAEVGALAIGDQLSVGDLRAPDGIVILDDPDTLVASVLAPQALEEEVGLPEGVQPEEIGAGSPSEGEGDAGEAGSASRQEKEA
jgi:large subunit ribosomal protein L25